MKSRIVAFLLAVALAAGTCLTGCGEKQEGVAVSLSKEETVEASSETSAKEEKVEEAELSTPEADNVPEVSTDGQKLIVFDDEYTLEQLGNNSNAILGVEVFGDYAIVQGHMGPHGGEYSIFNLRNRQVEYSFLGGSFVHGDKVWDSFYSQWTSVYDFSGNEVYRVEGVEIKDLELEGDKLKIIYWKDYADEEVFEDIIDRPECTNAAIYAYADYLHRECDETWKEFLSYAPEGALFMVMVNPFDDDEWIYSPSKAIDKGDTDHVYVVSLKKDLELEIDGNSSGKQGKGWNYRYDVMVSEGAPSHTIKATAPDGQTAEWPVTTISGEKDLRWIFK